MTLMYKHQTLIVSLNYTQIINWFFKSDWIITMLFQGQQRCWPRNMSHLVKSGSASVPGADRVRSRARSVPGADRLCSRAHSGLGPRSGLGTHRARSRARASPTLAPLCAHCARPTSTPRAWPTSLLDIFLFSVCGASGIRSLKGGGYVTVLLVCPGWPPDVSVFWAHGLLFIGAMCSHVDCLSPPILLLNHCFSGSSCVSLVTLVCLPI